MARHRLDLIVVKPGNRPEHDVIRVILTFAVPPQAKLTRQILRGLTRQRWYRSAPALAGRSMTLGATADGRRAIIEVPAFRNSVPDDLCVGGWPVGNQAIGRGTQAHVDPAPFHVVAACNDDYNPE